MRERVYTRIINIKAVVCVGHLWFIQHKLLFSDGHQFALLFHYAFWVLLYFHFFWLNHWELVLHKLILTRNLKVHYPVTRTRWVQIEFGHFLILPFSVIGVFHTLWLKQRILIWIFTWLKFWELLESPLFFEIIVDLIYAISNLIKIEDRVTLRIVGSRRSVLLELRLNAEIELGLIVFTLWLLNLDRVEIEWDLLILLMLVGVG